MFKFLKNNVINCKRKNIDILILVCVVNIHGKMPMQWNSRITSNYANKHYWINHFIHSPVDCRSGLTPHWLQGTHPFIHLFSPYDDYYVWNAILCKLAIESHTYTNRLVHKYYLLPTTFIHYRIILKYFRTYKVNDFVSHMFCWCDLF